MAGVPVDVLVNVGSPLPQQSTLQASFLPAGLLDSEPLDAAEDDTFGLFTKLAISSTEAEPATPLRLLASSSETNLGLLIEVEECSEVKQKDIIKKPLVSASSTGSSSSSRLMDSIVDSPFALAWDLIEEGARTLAEDIKANKVDMNTGPDSPLMSPTSLKKQQPASFLVDSSPEQTARHATPKPAAHPKNAVASKKTVITPSLKFGASSGAATPGPSRAMTNSALKNRTTPQTPSRSVSIVKRKPVALPPSPLTNQQASAGNPAVPRAKTSAQPPIFKAPLKPKLSAPATTTALPRSTTRGPIKAAYNHTPHPGTPRPPLKATPIPSVEKRTPASLPTSAKPPLMRTVSNLTKSDEKGFQRQGSLRLPSKRTSFGPSVSKTSLNSSACSDASSTASDVGSSSKFTSKLGTPRTSLLYRNKENKPN